MGVRIDDTTHPIHQPILLTKLLSIPNIGTRLYLQKNQSLIRTPILNIIAMSSLMIIKLVLLPNPLLSVIDIFLQIGPLVFGVVID